MPFENMGVGQQLSEPRLLLPQCCDRSRGEDQSRKWQLPDSQRTAIIRFGSRAGENMSTLMLPACIRRLRAQVMSRRHIRLAPMENDSESFHRSCISTTRCSSQLTPHYRDKKHGGCLLNTLFHNSSAPPASRHCSYAKSQGSREILHH